MKQDFTTSRVYNLSGMFTLTLRLVVGWTYFSVFWRRIVLENRLVEDSPWDISENNLIIFFQMHWELDP